MTVRENGLIDSSPEPQEEAPEGPPALSPRPHVMNAGRNYVNRTESGAVGANGSICRFANAPDLLWNISAVVGSAPPQPTTPAPLPPGLGPTSGLRSRAGLWTLGSSSSTCRQPHQILFPAQNTIIQAEGEQLRLRNTDEGGAGKQTLKDTVGGSLPDRPRLRTGSSTSLEPRPRGQVVPGKRPTTEREAVLGSSPPLLPLHEDGDRVKHCGSLGVVPG